MYNLYKEYLESEETDLEYFDWLDNQILLRSRDRKLEEANKKIKEMNQKTEEANKKYENLINEINEMIDETKESIIKYSQLKFHEDISISINTLSKNQIFDLLDHLYDFKEFEELKKYLQDLKI
jgi:predicted transcriptional regulator